jgi:hypothetical protein
MDFCQGKEVPPCVFILAWTLQFFSDFSKGLVSFSDGTCQWCQHSVNNSYPVPLVVQTDLLQEMNAKMRIRIRSFVVNPDSIPLCYTDAFPWKSCISSKVIYCYWIRITFFLVRFERWVKSNIKYLWQKLRSSRCLVCICTLIILSGGMSYHGFFFF